MLYKYGKHMHTFWGHFYFYFSSSHVYFGGIFNKAIIPLVLGTYKIFIANSALHASLAIIYHLLSNTCSGNNY